VIILLSSIHSIHVFPLQYYLRGIHIFVRSCIYIGVSVMNHAGIVRNNVITRIGSRRTFAPKRLLLSLENTRARARQRRRPTHTSGSVRLVLSKPNVALLPVV